MLFYKFSSRPLWRGWLLKPSSRPCNASRHRDLDSSGSPPPCASDTGIWTLLIPLVHVPLSQTITYWPRSYHNLILILLLNCIIHCYFSFIWSWHCWRNCQLQMNEKYFYDSKLDLLWSILINSHDALFKTSRFTFDTFYSFSTWKVVRNLWKAFTRS